MKRRDTIIIAAAINVVLLAILLITAIKTEPEAPKIGYQTPQIPRAELTLAAAAPAEIAPLQTEPEPLSVTSEPAEMQIVAAPLSPAPPLMQTVWKTTTVKKGDTLEKIAKRSGTTVAMLVAQNKLKSKMVNIGQKVKVPTKIAVNQESNRVGPISAPAEISNNDVKYYVVKSGDSPWTIAVKNKMKLEDLLKLNGLDNEKARRLKPGDRLRIR